MNQRMIHFDLAAAQADPRRVRSIYQLNNPPDEVRFAGDWVCLRQGNHVETYTSGPLPNGPNEPDETYHELRLTSGVVEPMTPEAIVKLTLEAAAKACEAYAEEQWYLYKHGRGPERANPHVQGLSCGADDCAVIIKKLDPAAILAQASLEFDCPKCGIPGKGLSHCNHCDEFIPMTLVATGESRTEKL